MLVTTTAEQASIGKLARKLGGYHELVRLSAEMTRYPKGEFDLVKRSDGKFDVMPKPGWQARKRQAFVHEALAKKRASDYRKAYWWWFPT